MDLLSLLSLLKWLSLLPITYYLLPIPITYSLPTLDDKIDSM